MILSMNKFFIFFPLFIFANGPKITYEFSGGRFGDNLLSYLHAKWLSYQHHIPLSYIPFPYSDELMLDSIEQKLDPNDSTIHPLTQFSELSSPLPITYTCPYFPESQRELKKGNYFSFKVNWKDPIFRQITLECLSPKRALQVIYPPQNTINIALHYREGGGVDSLSTQRMYPLKLPPIEFYIETLTKILHLLPQSSIYCYLFTDAQNPQAIIQKIQKEKQLSTIQWDYRKTKNTLFVLDDFFSFFQFHILIRPESNFSIIPSLLHDFAIVCYPTHFVKKSKSIKIDEITIETNPILLKKITQ